MPKDVHPQIQALLNTMAELGVPKAHELDTQGARDLVENTAAARRKTYPPKEVFSVENATTGPSYGHVPVRIYRVSADTDAPVIVFYHGGGHVIGSLDSYEGVCRFMANECGATVVSVDYRMGPEYPFPAAVEDCFNATRWVGDKAEALGVDPAKIAVCGDSAGANLAAVVALLARDAGLDLAAQVLVYPVVDYRGGTQSHKTYAKGYGVLEAETVAWFRDRYVQDAALLDDWRVCPKNAPSHEGLPPAIVITAECDVLRDESVAYGQQLQDAGVPVEFVEYAGMTHGFFSYFGLVDDAENAHRAVAEFVARVW